MIIFPAIDLYDKKAVRLYKGDYANMTVYSESPVDVARGMEAVGATHIHMVDLEGAKDGTTPNLDIVARVARETGLFVEIGGGIRRMETIERYAESGVKRVILGTAAVEDSRFLAEAIRTYGDMISVGADVKDGYIAIRGWIEKTPLTLDDFVVRMMDMGVRHMICTDISKDGAMRGTNLALYRELSKKYTLDITASGGVSSLDDVRRLRAMELYGAIVGKAYYTGDIDIAEAMEAAR